MLYVITGEHYAGFEHVQGLLAACFPGEGFDVGFVCLTLGQFPTKRKFQQASLYLSPMRSRLDWNATRRIVQIVRDEQYSIIHKHTAHSAIVVALAVTFSRVSMIHRVHIPTLRNAIHLMRNWINATVGEIDLRTAARLITISQSLGQYMIEVWFGKETSVSFPTVSPNQRHAPNAWPPNGI